MNRDWNFAAVLLRPSSHRLLESIQLGRSLLGGGLVRDSTTAIRA